MDDIKELKGLLNRIKTLLGIVVAAFLFMFYVVDEQSGEIEDLKLQIETSIKVLDEQRIDDLRSQSSINLNLKAARDKHILQLESLEERSPK